MRPFIGPRVTFRLAEDDLSEVNRRAEALGLKRSEYLRLVVRLHLLAGGDKAITTKEGERDE